MGAGARGMPVAAHAMAAARGATNENEPGPAVAAAAAAITAATSAPQVALGARLALGAAVKEPVRLAVKLAKALATESRIVATPLFGATELRSSIGRPAPPPASCAWVAVGVAAAPAERNPVDGKLWAGRAAKTGSSAHME